MVSGLIVPEMAFADCRTVAVTANGQRVVGIEDIALDAPRGQAVLSAYDRRADTDGGLYLLDLVALDGADRVEVRTLADGLRPHGIDLRAEEDGTRTVLAVNRRRDGSTTVERYRLDGTELRHRGTVADPLLCRVNDVAALDGDRFLFTSSHGGCGWASVLWENVMGQRGGFVGLAEAGGVRVLASGIGFANGILAVPEQDRLYVAATRERAVLVYPLSALLSGGTATPQRIAVPGGPDNLSAGPDGGVLMALHPSLFRLALHRYGWPGGETARSRVAVLDGGILLDEDGGRFSAATVAVGWDGRLLMGSVTADGLLFCTGATRSSAPAERSAKR
ncbi:SMP-30/gluconolactonase/LRE family protein [Azospirillum soli]|uniref:SMP-30/gluconolactonase/LRE family protein n=1 Tax=Azospirillum soli TaxID=1304799 RepID=UPI001FE7AC0A|nr:hypothetical protein [Azospirillum soli]MBP2314820.1 hypothetical protein [Azospirillum soli]